jgi:hypothetical protein
MSCGLSLVLMAAIPVEWAEKGVRDLLFAKE